MLFEVEFTDRSAPRRDGVEQLASFKEARAFALERLRVDPGDTVDILMYGDIHKGALLADWRVDPDGSLTVLYRAPGVDLPANDD